MIAYRRFQNIDPPAICDLWHACDLGPSAADGFPTEILEVFVFAQPYFDRDGLIVAEHDGQLIGFVHASFACDESQQQLDHCKGVVSAIVVHPDFRRQGIGRKLLQKAEDYLKSRGATELSFGGGLDGNGFYNGLYGGLQASGFSHAATDWPGFLQPLDYSPGPSTLVMHRDLTEGRDPVNARLIKHRRRYHLSISENVANDTWWWHVRFGQLESLQFSLAAKSDQEVVATGQVHSLDVFVPKWGVRAVGIRDISVPEEHRRNGYGLSLVLESCKRLREQSIHLIEAQVDRQNEAAIELFQSAGFGQVQELVTYQKSLA